MTTPITPPTELVAQWTEKAEYWEGAYEKDIATQAAQWGADQELEACLRHLDAKGHHPTVLLALRAARRPKPPSLKEQALAALEVIPKLVGFENERDAIRAALEALDD